MRRFVVIGQRAAASGDFSLVDFPATSGRLDVLVRSLRAALLVSHGVRRDTVVYLVLLGGRAAPRTVRIEGERVKYLRPDERHLAMTLQKTLANEDPRDGFHEVRPGIAVARGGLNVALADAGASALYALDEHGIDLRDVEVDPTNALFVVGDHLGFDDATRAQLAGVAARFVSIGPVGVHAEDAISVASNELDRRHARAASGAPERVR